LREPQLVWRTGTTLSPKKGSSYNFFGGTLGAEAIFLLFVAGSIFKIQSQLK
jgi:hypothetical protein